MVRAKSKMPSRKWCFVPKCTNTSTKTPSKIFVTVPVAPKRRERWFAISRRNIKEVSPTSCVYCCEDHFDMEKDMENYMEYKLSNVKARMRPDVVPHIFTCQSDRDLLLTKPKQLGKSRARRKEMSYLHQSEGVSTIEQLQDVSQPTTSMPVLTCEKACQTKLIHFRSKYVQTTLKHKKQTLQYHL